MMRERRAIVVGASSGMGREVALLLLADGWQVGVAARRGDALHSLQAQFPNQVEVQVIDVNSPDAPSLLASLIEKMGGIDLYFHASGVGKQNMQLDPTIEHNTVLTNALGFTRMIDCVYGHMSQHEGGHIAVISSIAGTKGLGVAPGYSATKAFQNTYIEALEQQATMRHLPITFTDLRPGFVDTALLDDGNHYPMLMSPKRVAQSMLGAIYSKKRVAVIDWRYRLLTALWRRVPRLLWQYLPIK